MIDIGWWEATPAIIAAMLLLVIPGLVVLAPLHMGVVSRVALAGPVSVVAIGGAGIVFSAVGVAFAAWQPVLLAVVAAVGMILVRRLFVPLPGGGDPRWLALSWLLSASLIGVVAFAGVPSPELVSQTYDNVFHISAIADILSHGDASSLTLRTLIETDRSFAFYPAGWHGLAALVAQTTGAPIPVAVNASWIAVCALVWLPGCAWLAQVCLPRIAPGTAALTALPLGAAFGGMPYALLTWGTLYPTFLATALLPVAVAIPVLMWRGSRASRGRQRVRVVAWGGTATIVTLAAITLAQPRVLATWALLLAVPTLGVVLGWCRRGLSAGGAARARVLRGILMGAGAVLLLALAGAWYVIVRLGLFTRPLDDRLGGPQAAAVQPLWTGVWQTLAQSWLTGVGTASTWPAPLLAAAVILGAVVAWRARRTRWIVASYFVVAALFVVAAGSDDVLSKLATALWYKDKFRLSSALPVLGVLLATLGIAALARRTARRRTVTVAGGWIVAVTSAAVLAFTGVTTAVATVFRLPATAASDEVVSAEQIRFFGRLGEIVPEGEAVLGDPWDGSAWTLAFGDRKPVFPHVNGQWDADRQTLAWHLADIRANPEVCAALDRLAVRYVVYSPHAFGGGDPSGNHFPGPHEAVEAGLFTEVASDGDSRLFRIDECG